MTYQEQLKHPKWQKKRLEVLEAASFECQNCGCADKTLNVHHKVYVKGRKAWEYEIDELQCLCEDCHEKAHILKNELNKLVSGLPENAVNAVIGYIKAMMVANGYEPDILGNEAQCIGASDYFRINPHLGFFKVKDGPLPTADLYNLANSIHAYRFEKRRG